MHQASFLDFPTIMTKTSHSRFCDCVEEFLCLRRYTNTHVVGLSFFLFAISSCSCLYLKQENLIFWSSLFWFVHHMAYSKQNKLITKQNTPSVSGKLFLLGKKPLQNFIYVSPEKVNVHLLFKVGPKPCCAIYWIVVILLKQNKLWFFRVHWPE